MVRIPSEPARTARGRALPGLAPAALLLSLFSPAGWAFSVFACGPEWAALTRALMPGAPVFSATHARQDPHHIEARPALIARLRQADLAVCTGAGLEAGWLPTLQDRAGNPRVQPGQPGLFLAAEHVDLIDARPGAVAHPFAGDVHAEGNPHLHTDPHRLRRVAAALALRLQQLRPAEASQIAERHRRFDADWAARLARWERDAQALRGSRVVAQHSTHAYLFRWLGIEQVADLEPRPGMPPSPGHLAALRDRLKTTPVHAIVVALHHDARAARWLEQQWDGKVPVRVLPATVVDDSAPEALAGWFDDTLASLRSARGEARP